MEFKAPCILKEENSDATVLCKGKVDEAGVRSVTEQDINTLGEQIAVAKMQNSENVDKKRHDVNQSAAKDGDNTERTTALCKETVDTEKTKSVTEQDINTLGEQIAVPNIQNSENVDKGRNDVSQSTANDGKNTERRKSNSPEIRVAAVASNIVRDDHVQC
jgi:hypothetical protein